MSMFCFQVFTRISVLWIALCTQYLNFSVVISSTHFFQKLNFSPVVMAKNELENDGSDFL